MNGLARVDERHGTVYRLFSESGDLLYVGCSISPATRLQQHTDKPWHAEIASATFEHFSTRREAAEAELRAIEEEGPRYNRQGNPVAMAEIATARERRRREEFERRQDLAQNYYPCKAECGNCGQKFGHIRKGYEPHERACTRCGVKALKKLEEAA